MVKRWNGQDTQRLNPIHQIKKVENYKNYKLCLVLTPLSYPNLHMGYRDHEFFAFRTDPSIQLYEPIQVLDYYDQKIFFKIPEMEWNTYIKDYKLYINSIKYLHDSIYSSRTETTNIQK